MDKHVKRAIVYMTGNLKRKFLLSEIAKHAGLSCSRLSHLFKVELGESPMAFLKSARLNESRTLLGTSHLGLKEIRERVGMTDASHFARDFKKAYGLTPHQYRASVVALDEETLSHRRVS